MSTSKAIVDKALSFFFFQESLRSSCDGELTRRYWAHNLFEAPGEIIIRETIREQYEFIHTPYNNQITNIEIKMCILTLTHACHAKRSILITFIGGHRSDNSEEEKQDSEDSTSKDNSKPKGKKIHVTKRSQDDPIFCTNLSEPIEDILEDTISEDIERKKQKGRTQQSQKVKSKLNKQRIESTSRIKKNKGEDVGEPFLKPNIPQTVTSEASIKIRSTERSVDEIEQSGNDDVGFSYVSVKEKGKKCKNKSVSTKKQSGESLNSLVTEEQKTTKAISKSITDNYQKKIYTGGL
ncbi:hypothetical protein NQ317_018894 [Molorchus minor]|uniref:Uncharacterized protein n=1 Tax=Molorchus minor TaxID=1323400 RepID=A0ABQ9IVV1_9CUCU|nr:hypothetical protein NQ317_018894 [Molorchus minor]